MNKVIELAKKHPAFMVIIYSIICAYCIDYVADNVENLFWKYAIDGLFGGLISFASIGYLILAIIWFIPIAVVLYVYVMSDTAKRLIAKKPGLCNVLFMISRALTGFYSLIAIVVFGKSIYQIFVSHTIDGYAADVAIAFVNIMPYVYGVATFFLVAMVFAGSNKSEDE